MDHAASYAELLGSMSPDAVRWAVRRESLVRLRRGLYAPDRTFSSTLAAALAALPSAVASHHSAAAVWGFAEASLPVHLTVPHALAVRSDRHVRIHRSRCGVAADVVGPWRLTDPERTVLDLARWCRPPEGTVFADAAVHARVCSLATLRDRLPDVRRLHRAERARLAIGLARDGAESPMETRCRLAVVAAGLPEPELQHVVVTADGAFRVDLAWPACRVCLEYDSLLWHGDRDRFIADRRRWRALAAAGWDVHPVTAADLRDTDRLVASLSRSLDRRAA